MGAAFSLNRVGGEIIYDAKPSLESYRDASFVVGQPIIDEKLPRARGA